MNACCSAISISEKDVYVWKVSVYAKKEYVILLLICFKRKYFELKLFKTNESKFVFIYSTEKESMFVEYLTYLTIFAVTCNRSA